MEELEPHIHVLQTQRSNLCFWLQRPSGYPLLIVTGLENEHSAAFQAGMRDRDIIFRLNRQYSWDFNIGEALMLIMDEDDDESINTDITIEWISAAHATLASRTAHTIRNTSRIVAQAELDNSQTSVSSQAADWDAERERQRRTVEQRRQRSLHQNMTPEQIERHRVRNLRQNMTDQQAARRRERNLHQNMADQQVARHRQRGRQQQHRIDASAITIEYAAPCIHCGFRFLVGEHNRDLCCGGGKATQLPFPALTPLSPNIRRIAVDYPRHFAEQSFQYNNLVAFAIIGLDNGDPDSPGFVRPPGGPHCIKIHGRTYHRVATADRQRNAVRYFVYDALDELRQHGVERNLNDDFVQVICDDLIDVNPYARELRQLGLELANEERETKEHDGEDENGDENGNAARHRRPREPPVAIRVTTRIGSRDVGAVLVRDRGATAERGTGSIMIHLYSDARPQYLENNDPQRDPLAYPLLFPHGDLGWGRGLTYDCDQAEYLRYRMLMPEPGLEVESQTGQQITVNRFQLLSRIGQVYLVDTISRIEENRLNYIRLNQAQYLDDDEAEPNGDGNDQANARPKRTFLPSSYTGSVRHLRKLAGNALALVSARGKPTVFITLTCNPNWPEIQRELLDGQTAFDRPDITCRVFHAKLEIILKLIRQGDVFGPEHTVEFEMRVIEFQFRGLPHAHVVMRLSGLPDENNVHGLAEWIDRHITATLPAVVEGDTDNDRVYAELVQSHMTHQCHRGANGCLDERNNCAKGFPKPITEGTHFNERGYPIYHRPTPQSCNVVPHNRTLLMLWNGHVNVEFAGYVFLVLYLYKYIFKGPDRARVEIREEDADHDEITRYVYARYLSSMECMWVTLRYHTYPSSLPPVKQVTVQMPHQLPEENKISDMLRYFHRPPELRQLRYTELFANYKIEKTRPQFAQADDYEHYSTTIKEIVHHYYRRRNQEQIICRMNTIYITAGEVWYLRLILLHRAVVSHEDARTVHGRIYGTFQEAAKAAGIATDENEAWLCFTSSLADSTPAQLRGLFVLLTREGYPTVRIYRDQECLDAMMADYLESQDSRQLAINALLQDLAGRMQDHSRQLSDYGLPEPDTVETELDRELRRYDVDEQREWIEAQPDPSFEQQAVLDAVTEAFENQEGLLIFVQGRGGSGKTWLMKRIIAEIRAREGIAQVCAATGLAATLYLHGTTAHSLFKVPVEDEADLEDEEHELKCKLEENSDRMELLKATNLIVWDEFPNNHRNTFEAIYRAMNGFENQILVACGDFRQIPPVVPGSDKWGVVDASVKSSPLWHNFKVFELTIAHRHASDPQYAAFVQNLGEGVLGEDLRYPDERGAPIANARVVPLQFVRAFSERAMDEAINFVYPDLANVLSLPDRAILAATNELVDEWNAAIQQKRCQLEIIADGAHPHAGMTHDLLSADILTECDDENGHIRRMLTTEFLNGLNRTGVPPHKLQLSAGDICIVMRNLNKKDGLTNNRRVVVLTIQPFSVKVQTIGPHPKVFALPRIRFKFRLPHGSFEVMRTQFPLRLAYCMTYNKSQGQELQAVLVDLRSPPFTHGHLYVALSRVRHRDGIAAFVADEDLEHLEAPCTVNIVYPELLERRTQRRAIQRARLT